MSTPGSSALRDRQRDLTRGLILEAFAHAVVETGIHQFSMQQVADGAGVSLRTLYRQFATREELIEGFSDDIHEVVLGEVWLQLPEDGVTADELVETVVTICHVMGRRREVFRAWAIIHMATAGLSDKRQDRTRRIERAVRELFPQLSPAEQDRVFAVVRVLAGSLAWKVMTDDLGLDIDDAAEATGWALRTLFHDLESGGRPTSRP